MCKECGCGLGGDVHIGGKPSSEVGPTGINASSQPGLSAVPHHQEPGPGHDQDHDHEHPHAPESAHPEGPQTEHRHQVLAIQQSLLDKNDRLAERNRGFFQAKRLLVLNVLSSPGSGKTTLIQKTAERLGQRLRLGVIVGDLATDNDARRLRTAGIPVVQIMTGTVCHLEAEMVARALSQIDVDSLDVLVIENVGNLVCPAAYDLGEHLRVVLLAVTEGEDKPLKYPPLFHSANVALLTKSDLAAATEFDREQALANLRRVSHHAQVFELSARTGHGMDPWCDFLAKRREAVKQ